MIKKNLFVENGYIYKIYQKHILLDSLEVLIKRINLINGFEYKKYRALTPTHIFEKDGIYQYRQLYLKSRKNLVLKKDHFLDIVDALNYFESIGFIHGDLNKKNIIVTDSGLKIIDYEPSLLQIREGKKEFMVTKPYISNDDILNGIVTQRTDKISFYYYVLRINRSMLPKDIVKLSRKLDHHEFIGISEQELVKMSYMEILDKAYEDL